MNILTAILLSLAIAACSTVRKPKDNGLQDMATALISHQLASPATYLKQNSRFAYYVTVGEADLSPNAIASLSHNGLVIFPGSTWSEGKGMRMFIGVPTQRPDGDFDVIHSYSCGIRCASLHMAVMRQGSNGWSVISSVMNLISEAPGSRPLVAASISLTSRSSGTRMYPIIKHPSGGASA